MHQLYTRFISQLDSLVTFLQLSREEVFDVMSRRQAEWLPTNQHAGAIQFSRYRLQVAQATFLLGYSYAEVFLNDLAREIYLNHPVMLPSDERIKFRQILEQSDFDELIAYMIDMTLFATFRGSMREIIHHFESTLNLRFRKRHRNSMIEASLIRNCIIHKMAVADERLAKHSSRWKQGETIELSTTDVACFGISARKAALLLMTQAEEQYAERHDAQEPAKAPKKGSGAGRGLGAEKIIMILEEERGVVGKAAKRLGISPKRLYQLLKFHNIQAREFR